MLPGYCYVSLFAGLKHIHKVESQETNSLLLPLFGNYPLPLRCNANAFAQRVSSITWSQLFTSLDTK